MIAKANNTTSDFPVIPPTPEGTYVAVCRGIVGIGTHKSGFKNPETGKDNWANQVVLLFELPTERIEINGKDVPRGINTFAITISLHPKANLTKLIETWRGRKFTEAEAKEGFDLKVLLGQNCLMSVINVEKGGKIYANIGGLLPMVKGTPTFEPENEVLYFEIDSGSVIPEGTPEWLKIKIFESREMRGHSKDDETGQQNHAPFPLNSLANNAPPEVAASERVDEQMVKEEFGIKAAEDVPF